jgi:hypothetical protein
MASSLLAPLSQLLLAFCVSGLVGGVASSTDKAKAKTLGIALTDFAMRIDTNLYDRLAATASALALEVGTGSGSKDKGGTAVLSLELKADEVIRVVAQMLDNPERFLKGLAKAVDVPLGPVYVHLYCNKRQENQQQRWQQSQQSKHPPLRCATPIQLLVTVSATPLTPDIAAAITTNGLGLNHNMWLLPPEFFFQAL